MDIRSQGFSSIDQIRESLNKQSIKTQDTKAENAQSFQEIFKEASEGVKFSKHAAERLETRSIAMTEAQKERLEGAVLQAKQKGMKESLVMVDNLAFILNVKNNTVITAVDNVKQGVFTNIDGAIIN